MEEAPPAPAPSEMRDAAWYPPELPENYGQDRLTLMVRDPHWLFCYWELSETRVAAARAELDGPCWKILRVHPMVRRCSQGSIVCVECRTEVVFNVLCHSRVATFGTFRHPLM